MDAVAVKVVMGVITVVDFVMRADDAVVVDVLAMDDADSEGISLFAFDAVVVVGAVVVGDGLVLLATILASPDVFVEGSVEWAVLISIRCTY